MSEGQKHAENGESKGEAAPKKSVWRCIRWGFAFILAAAGVLLLGFDVIRECTTVVSDGAQTETCGSISVSNALFVLGIACVLMLLAPDLEQIEFGNVKLRRRVEEVSLESKELRSEVASLSVAMSTATISSSNANVVNYLPDRNNLDEVLERIRRLEDSGSHLREESFPGQGAADSPEGAGGPKVNCAPGADDTPGDGAGSSGSHRAHGAPQFLNEEQVTRDRLSMELIRNWETISEALSYGPRPKNSKQRIWQRQLAEELREPLELTRRARNNVAHGQQISQDDLESATKLSRKLIHVVASWRDREE